MARPIARGFPYFNLDSDIFYTDRNIKALMGKYGIKVMCLYIYILCEVYRQEGYYCEYDDVFVGCAASTLNLSCGDIEEMLDGLLERSLFDKDLFENKKVLTSHGIQKRFQEMSRNRGRTTAVNVNSDLWLLSTDETFTYVDCSKNEGYTAQNHSYTANNPDYTSQNPTKVKESKINKSKVNESKEEESNTEAAGSSKHPYGEMENVLLTDEEFTKLKEKFPEDYQERIDSLSFGISSKGYKYKSHYATIVRWANDEKKGESVKIQVPALNNMLARCNAVLDQCNSLKADYGEIINLYNNLLSPRYITHTGSNGVVSITGLEKGRDYCFNFIPYDVIGINDEGEAESVAYTTNGGNTYISAVDMNYSTLSIPFDPTLDSTYFMLFEGNALPPVFKPYGTAAYINDAMLGSVYAEIDKVKDTLIVAQADENGAVKLSPDKVHSLAIDGDIRFVLPSVDTYCTITVQANVIGENAIDWGTTYFFKNEIPYIEEGEYDFFFEYDGAWYVGAVAKGQVIV